MLSTSLTTPLLSRRVRTALDPMEKAPQLRRLGVSLQPIELREREGGGRGGEGEREVGEEKDSERGSE